MAVKRIQNNLVPHYSKVEMDTIAEDFLTQYYAQALETPVAVPIKEIARKRLGLRILMIPLTEDLSVLGQMCFTSGLVEVYDHREGEYKEIRVRAGTMIIDPDTLDKRNRGCLNNTITHETVHWWKHRDYHILQSVLDKRYAKSCLYPATTLDEATQNEWTDEMWMEWHARNIAPRILMPARTVPMLLKEYGVSRIDSGDTQTIRGCVQAMAERFDVSIQSASIRLVELGITDKQ